MDNPSTEEEREAIIGIALMTQAFIEPSYDVDRWNQMFEITREYLDRGNDLQDMLEVQAGQKISLVISEDFEYFVETKLLDYYEDTG
jgi:hypothetical protein